MSNEYDDKRTYEGVDGERSKVVLHGLLVYNTAVYVSYVWWPIFDGGHREWNQGNTEIRIHGFMKYLKALWAFCSYLFWPRWGIHAKDV